MIPLTAELMSSYMTFTFRHFQLLIIAATAFICPNWLRAALTRKGRFESLQDGTSFDKETIGTFDLFPTSATKKVSGHVLKPTIAATCFFFMRYDNCTLLSTYEYLQDLLAKTKMIRAKFYACITRPYMVYVVSKLCQYMSNPNIAYWKSCKRVIRWEGLDGKEIRTIIEIILNTGIGRKVFQVVRKRSKYECTIDHEICLRSYLVIILNAAAGKRAGHKGVRCQRNSPTHDSSAYEKSLNNMASWLGRLNNMASWLVRLASGPSPRGPDH
ncbi:hypothetical protein SADUNF_Sadunf13G0097700 [Salix dunnii]|uniref:Uncharacterized protein n=1 Tax=Salix dunnii TaxID=1413687 RepID=A0A835MRG9_9ROSI|nr:hypothetical protein SADUNF_Sadunf13G0097700 [Salix dunnii]